MKYQYSSLKFIGIIILILVSFIACRRKKEPIADICPSKQIYKVHDTMRVVNCSKNYTKQRWLLPDGSTSTNDIVYYVANTPGTYAFTLYVGNDDFVSDYKTTLLIPAQ